MDRLIVIGLCLASAVGLVGVGWVLGYGAGWVAATLRAARVARSAFDRVRQS